MSLLRLLAGHATGAVILAGAMPMKAATLLLNGKRREALSGIAGQLVETVRRKVRAATATQVNPLSRRPVEARQHGNATVTSSATSPMDALATVADRG